MKITLARNPVVGYPAEAEVYNDVGEVQKIGLIVQYKLTDRKTIRSLFNGSLNIELERQGKELIKDEKGKPYKWPYKSDEEFCKDLVVGWRGVEDENGEAIEFSHEKLMALLSSYMELEQPVFNGFFHAHDGAREKN